MRMKKSGSRNTPSAAIRVTTEPASRNMAASHSKMSFRIMMSGSIFNECRKSDSGQKADQRDAQRHINERNRMRAHGGQCGHADPEHAQHVQSDHAVPRVRPANNADTDQNHRQKKYEFAQLDNDGKHSVNHGSTFIICRSNPCLMSSTTDSE